MRYDQETTGIRQVPSLAAESHYQADSSSAESGSEQLIADEGDKLVQLILKQLTPMVKNLVTMEMGRARPVGANQDGNNGGGLMSITPEVLMNMMFANGNPMMAGLLPRY